MQVKMLGQDLFQEEIHLQMVENQDLQVVVVVEEEKDFELVNLLEEQDSKQEQHWYLPNGLYSYQVLNEVEQDLIHF